MKRIEYIPIDFIKVQLIKFDLQKLKKSPILEWLPHYIKGKRLGYEYAYYKNLLFKAYPLGRFTIEGSLHMFSNDGEQNYNDFDICDFKAVLRQINGDLGIQPYQMRIIALEYGLNIIPPISALNCLNHLLFHGRNEFSKIKSDERGKFIESDLQLYKLKIYDKGMQFELPFELMRIEIHQANWSEYRQSGIVTLLDFINCNKAHFFERLLTQWNVLMFYDPTIVNPEKFIIYRDPNYWRGIFLKSRTTVKNHLDRLRKMNHEKGINVQGIVTQLMKSKLFELQKTDHAIG